MLGLVYHKGPLTFRNIVMLQSREILTKSLINCVEWELYQVLNVDSRKTWFYSSVFFSIIELKQWYFSAAFCKHSNYGLSSICLEESVENSRVTNVTNSNCGISTWRTMSWLLSIKNLPLCCNLYTIFFKLERCCEVGKETKESTNLLMSSVHLNVHESQNIN